MLRLTRQAIKDLVANGNANADSNIDGVLFDCWFCLFTSWPGWDADLTLADLTLANFDGYVGKAVTWSPAYIGNDQVPSSISNLVSWAPSSPDVPNSVLGVALATGNNTGDLLGIDAFDNAFGMINEDSRLNYALEYGIDPSNTFGNGSVIG